MPLPRTLSWTGLVLAGAGPALAGNAGAGETSPSLVGDLLANPTLLVLIAAVGGGIYLWRKRRGHERAPTVSDFDAAAAPPTKRAVERVAPRKEPGVAAPAGDSIAAVLASTPAVSRRRPRPVAPVETSYDEAVDEPAPRALHDADRLLARENLAERQAALLIQAVTLSSEVPAGPSALEFARRLARGGRAIFVDLEGETLSDAPGLAELVHGDAPFAEAIRRDDHSRLHLIGHGDASLGQGASIGLVVEALRETYDFVVLAGEIADDGTVLSAAEDADCVLLVPGPATPDDRVQAETRDLRAAGVSDVFVLETEMADVLEDA